MADKINDSEKLTQLDGAASEVEKIAGIFQPVLADKNQLLTAFLQENTEDAQSLIDNNTLRKTSYAEIIPLITFLQAPAGQSAIDQNILAKIQAKASPITSLRQRLSADGSCYEYSAANPPGLYGAPGKSYGDSNANPPAEYRALLSCKREPIPGGKKVAADTLWYGGAVKDEKGELFDFAAADYHNITNFALDYRLVQYDQHNGSGPDLKFQGLPDDVGKNAHSMHIVKNQDGQTFSVEITSYPQWMKNPDNNKSGWVPLRTKIVVGADGTVFDQKVGGGTAKYTQYFQSQDWKYDAKAWKAPYPPGWGGPPK